MKPTPTPSITCAVFDDEEIVLFGERHHRIHVRRLTEEMHGDDGLRFRRDLGRGLLRINVEANRAGIHKHRSGSHAGDAAGSGKKGERGHQHFIARTNAKRHECKQDGICAGRAADAMLALDHRGDFFFQRITLRPHDELARAQHTGEGGGEFSFEREVLGVDVE